MSGPDERTHGHHAEGANRNSGEQARIPTTPAAEDQRDNEIHRDDDRHNRKEIVENQDARLAPRRVLKFEKVHMTQVILGGSSAVNRNPL